MDRAPYGAIVFANITANIIFLKKAGFHYETGPPGLLVKMNIRLHLLGHYTKLL